MITNTQVRTTRHAASHAFIPPPGNLRKPAARVCLRRRAAERRPPSGGPGANELAQFLPLVRQVAFEVRRSLPPQVEIEDLMGAGAVGLMEAAAKFDAAKRVSFKAYARHRIRGAILDSLRKEDRASRTLRRKIRRAERASHALEGRFARPATAEEMAGELGMSLAEWHQTAAEAERAKPSPAPFPEDLERRCLPAEPPAASGSDDPFEECYRNEMRKILSSALGCLEERDRRMIRHYYFESRTMKEIGAALGVDESRISQLHTRALARLRQCLEAMLKPRAA